MSEAAFLIMDLEEHGYPHFGHQFLNEYLQFTGDYEDLMLLPYYSSINPILQNLDV